MPLNLTLSWCLFLFPPTNKLKISEKRRRYPRTYESVGSVMHSGQRRNLLRERCSKTLRHLLIHPRQIHVTVHDLGRAGVSHFQLKPGNVSMSKDMVAGEGVAQGVVRPSFPIGIPSRSITKPCPSDGPLGRTYGVILLTRSYAQPRL